MPCPPPASERGAPPPLAGSVIDLDADCATRLAAAEAAAQAVEAARQAAAAQAPMDAVRFHLSSPASILQDVGINPHTGIAVHTACWNFWPC